MTRSYFDYNASSPLRREVLESMGPLWAEVYGNASSIHFHGQTAKRVLEESRRKVARLLDCDPAEVVFVSGGTEGDNLAIRGIVEGVKRESKHVITTAVEHPAVLQTVSALAAFGIEVTVVRPDASGVVDPGEVKRAIRPDTVLISVMHVNNETGAVQPLREIAAIAQERGILFHSDGVQAPGRVPVNVRELGVDAYTVSGHKIGGPKGVGALYLRKGVVLGKTMFGGRQERDRRAGTENVPAIAGMGQAAEICAREFPAEAQRVRVLRDWLEQQILARVPESARNGDAHRRAPNTANLRFTGVNGESMVIALDMQGFSVSSGAACSSGSVEPSHVLLAMGLSDEEARSSLRFSLGWGTKKEEVEALVEAVVETVGRLRAISPGYLKTTGARKAAPAAPERKG